MNFDYYSLPVKQHFDASYFARGITAKNLFVIVAKADLKIDSTR